MKTQNLKEKVEFKIRRSRKDVFLRRDFDKLGGYDQVGRALRYLVAEKKLLRLGYGLYAKARINKISGDVMPASSGGFYGVATEALKRLKVDWDFSSETKDYTEGKTAQVPVKPKVVVSGRFSRKIQTDRYKLQITKKVDD